MDWAQILVITLAVLFAIFLTVTTILVVLLVKVTRQIKSAAASAERTVHAIESSAYRFNKAALPIMAIRGIMTHVKKRSQHKKGDRNE